MNEQDNAPLESPSGDSDTPPPTERYLSRGDGLIFDNNTGNTFKGHDLTVVELNQLERRAMSFEHELTTALEKIRGLRNEQIMGDDHRLTEFWDKAQELADRAGHCKVYDEIAEALGGPRREREYNVHFTYTYCFTVSARDEESAIDFATEMVEDSVTIGELYVENTYVEEA